MKRSIRGAICRIDVVQDGKSVSRGTGTLVAPGIVLTALSVVADRHAVPPTLFAGPVTLTFPGHKTSARIHGENLDPEADWVLLSCDSPPPAIPVPMGRLSSGKVAWETHGFPDSNAVDGVARAGTVDSVAGNRGAVAAFRLLSEEAVADHGAAVRGLSGAPVIVAGWMVGHVRSELLQEDQPVGMLSACPAGTVADRCPELLTVGEVSRRLSMTPEPRDGRWTRRMVLVGVVLAAGVVIFLVRAYFQ